MPAKRIQLTKFRINKVMRNQHTGSLTKNIKAFGLEKRWAETGFANRFKAMVLRRQVAKHVRSWVKKNKSK